MYLSSSVAAGLISPVGMVLLANGVRPQAAAVAALGQVDVLRLFLVAAAWIGEFQADDFLVFVIERNLGGAGAHEQFADLGSGFRTLAGRRLHEERLLLAYLFCFHRSTFHRS